MRAINFCLSHIFFPAFTILSPAVFLFVVNNVSEAVRLIASGGFILSSLFMVLYVADEIQQLSASADSKTTYGRRLRLAQKILNYYSLVVAIVFAFEVAHFFSLEESEFATILLLAKFSALFFALSAGVLIILYWQFISPLAVKLGVYEPV